MPRATTSLLFFFTILCYGCTTIDSVQLYLDKTESTQMAPCPLIYETEGFVFNKQHHLSACDYRMEDYRKDWWSGWNYTSRTSMTLNGIGATWDENGNIVSYDTKNGHIYVDEDGNFSGASIGGKGISWNGMENTTKRFGFSLSKGDQPAASSDCMLSLDRRIIEIIQDDETYLTWERNDQGLFTCMGKILQKDYLLQWDINSEIASITFESEQISLNITRPQRVLIDGSAVTRLPLGAHAATCFSSNSTTRSCMAYDYPQTILYLNQNQSPETLAAITNAFFALHMLKEQLGSRDGSLKI